MIRDKFSAVVYGVMFLAGIGGLLFLYGVMRTVCALPRSSGPISETLGSLCTKEDAFTTVAQIIPATVVAVFVFGLGMVFVIAQMIVPGRGSRSLTVMFRYVRIQYVVSFGLALLVGSILMTGSADQRDDGLLSVVDDVLGFVASSVLSTIIDTPEVDRDRHLDVAAALTVATALYVVVAFICILATFVSVVDPDKFRKRLDKKPVYLRFRKDWTPDELYEALRIYRGWVRTVNRVGESRDLVFCVEGIVGLIDKYNGQVRRSTVRPARSGWRRWVHRAAPPDSQPTEEQEPKLRKEAAKLETGREIRIAEIVEEAGVNWPPINGNGIARPYAGRRWFADEVRRAVVRAIESGLAAGTLRRDLDRMLDIFDDAFTILMKPDVKDKIEKELCLDVSVLVGGVAEVAGAVKYCPAEQRGWFENPIARIARYRLVIEGLARARNQPHHRDLSEQTLRLLTDAWVVYASALPTDDLDPLLPMIHRCLCVIEASDDLRSRILERSLWVPPETDPRRVGILRVRKALMDAPVERTQLQVCGVR